MPLTDQALSQWTPESPGEVPAFVAAVQARARAEGVALDAPPEPPDNCCGNDCIECVWVGHYSALAYWRDEALLRWAP